MVQNFKIDFKSGLIIINPWTYNKLATCREILSTPVKEQNQNIR